MLSQKTPPNNQMHLKDRAYRCSSVLEYVLIMHVALTSVKAGERDLTLTDFKTYCKAMIIKSMLVD